VLGTNPWFKKPRPIGEKVDRLRMVLKVGSGQLGMGSALDIGITTTNSEGPQYMVLWFGTDLDNCLEW